MLITAAIPKRSPSGIFRSSGPVKLYILLAVKAVCLLGFLTQTCHNPMWQNCSPALVCLSPGMDLKEMQMAAYGSMA